MASLSTLIAGTFLGTPVWFWLVFVAVVVTLLVLDLGVLHRKTKDISARESFLLYGFYMAVALAFGGFVWWTRGQQAGLEFFTGYLIEQSLSMDNVFVIAMIFGFLAIPRHLQHRVLFWGILGVVVFRAILIGAGAALVHSFDWILFVFGAFLVFTGFKMFAKKEEKQDLSDNPIYAFLKRHFRLTDDLHGQNFTVMKKDEASGRMVRYMTPLLVTLIMVELVDLIFAVDSVPAIFAITQDPFIVYTSNIFAILGLRSLYFALAAAIHRFRYLQYSLAIVLVLVGIKIFLVPLGVKIDTVLSLIATVGILAGGIIYSLWATRRDLPQRMADEGGLRLGGSKPPP
ncbi:MAG TPA: TerC family protein [Aestuariivirga sp.]|nr:TerC family protein [Aestuariivirga sp.]